jgi:hypothetical protein
MRDQSGKHVLFVCEKYFLRFYRPIAARLRRAGLDPVWVAVDGLDEWDGTCVDLTAALEELAGAPDHEDRDDVDAPWEFERVVFDRPGVFSASYPYTLNVVRTPERAARLAPAWYRVTLALLARLRPRATFVWNGRYLPYSAVSAACTAAGQLLLTSEIGWVPGTMILDRGPLSADTLDLRGKGIEAAGTEDLGRAEAFLHDYTTRKATMVSQPVLVPAEVRERLLGPDATFLLLYGCQVDWDTNVIIGARRFQTNEAAVSFLLECLSGVPGARLVVKTHPLDTGRNEYVLREILGSRGTVVTDIHPHTLIEAADCVAVRNSTLGFETLCYGKPLMLLEPAKYGHPRLTLPARDVTEGAAALASVSAGEHQVPDRTALREFILHTIDRYLVPIGYRYYFQPDTLGILAHFGRNRSQEFLEQLLLATPGPADVPADRRALRAVGRCAWRRPRRWFFGRQARKISGWLG